MKLKGLLAGIVLLVVVGLAGFTYRAIIERPVAPRVDACTLDAKVCPDGSAVGRKLPACNFDPCPSPNVTLAGVVFLPPSNYTLLPSAVGDGVIADYVASSTASTSQEIVIHDYPIPSGTTAEEIMNSTAVGDASGAPVGPTAFSAVTLGGTTYSVALLGRFEGVVHVAYYVPRDGHVLRFDSIDRGVAGWTNPNLDPATLPAVKALRALLSSLESA